MLGLFICHLGICGPFWKKQKNDTSGFKMILERIFWVVWTDTPTGILPRREVQDAFKVLMTHWILQFALRIAFRCVLHRCGNQDIRRWKCISRYVFGLCVLIINKLNQSSKARLNKNKFTMTRSVVKPTENHRETIFLGWPHRRRFWRTFYTPIEPLIILTKRGKIK